LLGSFNFNTTGNTNTGTVDSFNLTLPSGAAQNLFLSDIKNGSTIRFALGATDPTTAATFGGSTSLIGTAPNQVSGAPILSFNTSTPVPEASTTASFGLLLVLGLGGIVVARRRKQA